MSKSNSASETISLPKGGGALRGLGEKFAPDLQTGTGNFSVPIALPSGRHGFQPELSLVYSSGSGNGVFGLGWSLSLPGISRKTFHGVPHYNEVTPSRDERRDVFILSGAEDLEPISGAYPGRMRYCPRTEGLFARIEHTRDTTGNYWEVRSKDGLVTRYGAPRPPGGGIDWQDPAVTRDPASADTDRVFAWKITETRDPFGNHIRYEYLADQGDEPGHQWNQPHIRRLDYGDYGDPARPSYLVAVEFEYEQRPDPYSDF
jgi:virulence plasmid B protein